jgi:hypothetical protein
METEVIAFLSEVINLQTGTIIQTDNSSIKFKQTGNTINIESLESTSTSLYDCIGRIILQTKEKSFSINQTGLFIVKIKTPQAESNFKVIIK